MATDLEDHNEVGKSELSSIEEDLSKVKANGGIVHQEALINGDKKENGHVKTSDPAAQTDHSQSLEEAPVVEEKIEEEESVDVVEKPQPQPEIESEEVKVEEETHQDEDVNVEEAEVLKCQSKEVEEGLENSAKLGSDEEIVEEIQESVSEAADVVDSGSNQPDHEEKVEEEIKQQQQQEEVVPAVETNSVPLENGDNKVEDEVTSVCESVKDLNPETVATDSVESELVQPLDGDSNSDEVNERAASKEAEVDQNSHSTIVEVPESEFQKVDDEEQVEEQGGLESPVQVCQPQDMEITATQPVENETSHLADGRELDPEESADYIFVEKPSSHLQTENLVSGDATCKTDSVQVETEATDVANETEGSLNTPLEHAAPETEVINGSNNTQDTNLIDATGQIELEAPEENGHVEVVELKQEADDALTENEGRLLAPDVSTDVDLSATTEESILTSSADDMKSEAGLGNGSTNDEAANGESSTSHLAEQSTLETEAVTDSVDENDKIASSPSQENGNIEDAALLSSGIQLKPDESPEIPSVHKEVEVSVDPNACEDLEVPVQRDEDTPALPSSDIQLKPDESTEILSVDKEVEASADPDAREDLEVSVQTDEDTPALPSSDIQLKPDESTEILSVHKEVEVSVDPAACEDIEVPVQRDEDTPALPSSGLQLKPDESTEVQSVHKEVEVFVDPATCQDMEAPVQRDEDTPACSIDDLKSEAIPNNDSNELSQSVPVIGENDLEKDANATEDFSAPVKSELSNHNAGESKPDLDNDLKDAENEQDLTTCADANGDHSGVGNDSNMSLSPSPEDSTTGDLEGTNVEIEKPFRYLIRIPRYVDERFRTQIDLAQKQVDEKTRIRDELRSTFQSRRGIVGEYRDKFQAARSEERASRDALHAKRKEMDSVLLVINRMKNANSIEDIGDRVRGMQHRIEHETVPLKEEKQLIREIKQLKTLRDQLSSSMGQQAELEPTTDERVKTEERFKILKQEMESCKKEVMRLEGITKAAWKVYNEENEKMRELQDQFRASDDLRQEAYLHLQKLKKQFYEKNHYYRMFIENVMKAKDYASAKDTESLHIHCIKQVENIMELWNKNDEFRNEYIRCNKFNTLRRLGTADGRALGPDEPAPVLYPVREAKVDQPVLASSNKSDFPSLPASEQSKSVVANLEEKKPKVDSKPVVNLEQKQSTLKSKTVTKPLVPDNSSATVSRKEEEQENEEVKRNREKEELARKEEELRKKEEAVKLKEQRRLEEKAKAKEAEERKKRNAEKAQARAQLKAQKEAELKEKEREKRARKKERKKEKSEEGLESSSVTEEIQPEITTREPEIKEKPAKTAVKRLVIAKQAKPKVIPPPLPLRNRGKKRMQQWMWVLLVVVAIIALFFIGNIGFSFNFGLSGFGF